MKKCCQPSHGGIPTGAPAGSGYSPGYAMRNSCIGSRLSSHRTATTAIAAAYSSPPPATMTAPAHCRRVNGPIRSGSGAGVRRPESRSSSKTAAALPGKTVCVNGRGVRSRGAGTVSRAVRDLRRRGGLVRQRLRGGLLGWRLGRVDSAQVALLDASRALKRPNLPPRRVPRPGRAAQVAPLVASRALKRPNLPPERSPRERFPRAARRRHRARAGGRGVPADRPRQGWVPGSRMPPAAPSRMPPPVRGARMPPHPTPRALRRPHRAAIRRAWG